MENLNTVTEENLMVFADWLKANEKARATVEKYVRDVQAFSVWLADATITKEAAIEYKQYLMDEKGRDATGVNTVIAALNNYFVYAGLDIRLKPLKIQRRTFLSEEEVLSKAEYKRLLTAARSMGNIRLYLALQTICSTGIRVSELRFINVEAARSGEASITNKGKTRTVFLPTELKPLLLRYAEAHEIQSGSIFITKNGTPLNRSNIWTEMKNLYETAGVDPSKIYPHNLRALFARRFYSIDKDLVRLADLLGHSRVDTTRRYLMESGEQHRQRVDALDLIIT